MVQSFREAIDEAGKKENLTIKDIQKIRVEFDKLKTAPETARLATKIEPHLGLLERMIKERKGDHRAVFEAIKDIKTSFSSWMKEVEGAYDERAIGVRFTE